MRGETGRGRSRGSWLWWTRRDVERAPAGVGRGVSEIAFVVVGRELRGRARRFPGAASGGPLGRGLAQSTRRSFLALAFDGQAQVEILPRADEKLDSTRESARRRRTRVAFAVKQLRPAAPLPVRRRGPRPAAPALARILVQSRQ